MAEISRLLCVSERSVRRYIIQFDSTGDVQPTVQQHGPSKLLGDYEQVVLLQTIMEDPGIYLHEIQAKLLATFGVFVSVATICSPKVHGLYMAGDPTHPSATE